MILIDSSWSGLPHAPNIIAPRQNWLTETPVRPNGRCSMPAPCGCVDHERGDRSALDASSWHTPTRSDDQVGAGDAVLTAVADSLSAVVRPGDVLRRPASPRAAYGQGDSGIRSRIIGQRR